MDGTGEVRKLSSQFSGLASPELYADGDDVVNGYDSSGSCLCGAPRPAPAPELVDPARRWSGDASQPPA